MRSLKSYTFSFSTTTPNPTSENTAVPPPKRTAIDRRPDIQTSRMVHPSAAMRQPKSKYTSCFIALLI
jgi:hypothetical protein